MFPGEAPEFSPTVLDTLRQPLESGSITIHRAKTVATFPGRFQLVLAANPCACGQYGAPESSCSCPPSSRRRYLTRLSGPLLDRIDLQLQVPRVSAAQLRMGAGNTTTAQARARVVAARERSAARLAATPWRRNAEVPGSWLRNGPARPARSALSTLDRAFERGQLSMRGYDRVLRVAWTIADLEGLDAPGPDQVGHALLLRTALAG